MKLKELGENWHIYYESCLRSYRVKEAALIANYYRPAKLYKYFSFKSPFWKNNTEGQEIAHALCIRFNDPMDSRWFLDYDKILTARFAEIGQTFSREEYSFIDEELYEEDLLYLREFYCMSCFSTTPHSNLMWGHYADKHTGFCLEYDVSKFPREMQALFPIVYTDLPFDASDILDMRGIDDKLAVLCPYLFKSSDWKYEREWRTFIPFENGDKNPIVVTAENAVSGVYYGFRSYSSKERAELEKWAAERNIPQYQIERAYMSFDFVSDNIEDIRSSKKIKGLMI